MANCDSAAVRVDAGILEIDVQTAQAAENLCGEGLIDLDDVHVLQVETGAFQGFLGGGDGAVTHDARGDAGNGGRDDAGDGFAPGFVAGVAACDDDHGGAIVDAGGIASRRHAAFKDRAQFFQIIERRLRAGVLVV